MFDVEDNGDSGGGAPQQPGVQNDVLPTRSQLRSNDALLDHTQLRNELEEESSSKLTTSWVQSQKSLPERLDGSLKAGEIVRGYQGRAKLTSGMRRKALSIYSESPSCKHMHEQLTVPADFGPSRPVDHRSVRVEKKKTSTGTGRQRQGSPVPVEEKDEVRSFHHSKPLRQQHESHRAPPSMSSSETQHKRDEEIVDEVVEDIVQGDVHASRTLPLLTRTATRSLLSMELPLPEKSATRVMSPSTAARLKGFMGNENVAGGGGFVPTGRPLPKNRPIGCLLGVEELHDLSSSRETGDSGFVGGRGLTGGCVSSARPGGSPPVKNSGFMGVRVKGERLVGGGFYAFMPPSSQDYPRLCISRTRADVVLKNRLMSI